MNIKITVNGKVYEKVVSPNQRLLDFLRENLGLKGEKKGRKGRKLKEREYLNYLYLRK